MTRIEFYFNVANKHQLVEDLVSAAVLKQRQVNILATDAIMAANLAQYLWQNNAHSFLPNTPAYSKHAAATPVVIGLQADDAILKQLNHDDLLINLTQILPNFFSRYTQLIELVGNDDADKIAGRHRYKFYRDRGYGIKNIDYNALNINTGI